MSKQADVLVSKHSTEGEGTLISYTIGFVLSVILSVWAYLLVVNNSWSRRAILTSIIVFALAQFMIQLLFFLHLGRETKPRLKFMAFLFMLLVALTVILGSLWIMNNLNYRMTPEQMEKYMKSQDGL